MEDWRKSAPSLTATLSHGFDTGLYTDMTFTIGPDKHHVNAHRAILMLRSEVFAVMLQERWEPANAAGKSRVVHIPHTNPEAFGIFLKYVYSDVITDPHPWWVLLEVLRLGHMYQVPGLVTRLCHLFKYDMVNVSSCVSIYQATRVYTLPDEEIVEVNQRTFAFIERNILAVSRSPSLLDFEEAVLIQFLQSDELYIKETELFEAVVRWNSEAKIPLEYKGDRRARLGNLIPYIRFPLMGSNAFSKVVVPTNVLSDAEMVNLFMYFNGHSAEGLRYSTHPRRRKRSQGRSPDQLEAVIGQSFYSQRFPTLQTASYSSASARPDSVGRPVSVCHICRHEPFVYGQEPYLCFHHHQQFLQGGQSDQSDDEEWQWTRMTHLTT